MLAPGTPATLPNETSTGVAAEPSRAVGKLRMAGWALLSLAAHAPIALRALRTRHPIGSGRDGHHYLAIARDLYADHTNLAFPPGYPMAIRLFAPWLGYEHAAWFVSLLASAVAAVLFGLVLAADGRGGPMRWGRVREEDFGVAVFLVGYYPWLHMASTPSSESLGMALMLAGTLALQRERALQAAFWLALASCSRISFFLLVPFFCWPYLKRRDYLRAALMAAAGFVGFALQHGLAYALLGSWSGLSDLQRAQWGSFVSYPFSAYFDRGFDHFGARLIVRVTLALEAMAFALIRLRKTRWFLQGAPMLLFLSGLSLPPFFRYGFDRQAIPILALYIWLHEESARIPRLRWLLLLGFAWISYVIGFELVDWQGNRAL